MNLEEQMIWAEQFGCEIKKLSLPRQTYMALVRGLYKDHPCGYLGNEGQPLSYDQWSNEILEMNKYFGEATYRISPLHNIRNFGIKGYRSLVYALEQQKSTLDPIDILREKAAFVAKQNPSLSRAQSVIARRANGNSWAAIAREMGVSSTRIRQLADAWPRAIRQIGDNPHAENLLREAINAG